jgi:thiamine-phosphate pyrophosphorylase
MTALPRGLYGMADASFGDPVEQVARLVAGGCRALQLRCKGWTTAQRVAAARAAHAHTAPAGVLLIINDDVSCAAAVGAEGVHLGQGDGELRLARAALRPGRLVGRSTHDERELAAARDEGADYVGFGPIFATTTKRTGFSTRGCERLAAAVRGFPGPVVAIGGIGVAQVPALAAAGAHAWAVGSGVWRAADPDRAIRALAQAEAPIEQARSR